MSDLAIFFVGFLGLVMLALGIVLHICVAYDLTEEYELVDGEVRKVER